MEAKSSQTHRKSRLISRGRTEGSSEDVVHRLDLDGVELMEEVEEGGEVSGSEEISQLTQSQSGSEQNELDLGVSDDGELGCSVADLLDGQLQLLADELLGPDGAAQHGNAGVLHLLGVAVQGVRPRLQHEPRVGRPDHRLLAGQVQAPLGAAPHDDLHHLLELGSGSEEGSVISKPALDTGANRLRDELDDGVRHEAPKKTRQRVALRRPGLGGEDVVTEEEVAGVPVEHFDQLE